MKYLKHEQEDKHFIKHQISCSYNVNVINVLLTALLAATLDTYMLNYERQKIPLAGSGIKPNTKTSKQVHNKKSNLLSLLPLEKTHILRRQRSLGQLIISRSRHNWWLAQHVGKLGWCGQGAGECSKHVVHMHRQHHLKVSKWPLKTKYTLLSVYCPQYCYTISFAMEPFAKSSK